jgi:thiamine-monophosphate kinase
MEIGEIRLVEAIRRQVAAPRGSRLITGIGDDCAVFRPRGAAEDLLITTDMLIENVHFLRHVHSPEAVGYRALARGLSDIAAMGGEPALCFLSLALAPWCNERWIKAFYRGFLALAKKHATILAGGDLARAPLLACDVVVCGSAPRAKALRRDGARPGHVIYVSGLLGGSALGLEKRKGRAWQWHLHPEPRLALGRFLRARASAAMDLSDGLSLDLHRLCLASGVAAAIGPPPRFPGATLEQALHGGEDYELLFTAPPRVPVPSRFRGLPLTRIGVIQKGQPGAVWLSDRLLRPLGYDHFRRP